MTDNTKPLGHYYQMGYHAGHQADAFQIEDISLQANRDAYSRGYENGARDRMREAEAAKREGDLLCKAYQRWAQREAENAEEIARFKGAFERTAEALDSANAMLSDERQRAANLRRDLEGTTRDLITERTARRVAESLAEERGEACEKYQALVTAQREANARLLKSLSATVAQLDKARADYTDLQRRVLRASDEARNEIG